MLLSFKKLVVVYVIVCWLRVFVEAVVLVNVVVLVVVLVLLLVLWVLPCTMGMLGVLAASALMVVVECVGCAVKGCVER